MPSGQRKTLLEWLLGTVQMGWEKNKVLTAIIVIAFIALISFQLSNAFLAGMVRYGLFAVLAYLFYVGYGDTFVSIYNSLFNRKEVEDGDSEAAAGRPAKASPAGDKGSEGAAEPNP